MINIKDMVSDGKRVKFKFYKDGNLWYQAENEFQFPIPVDDIGNATFLDEDKAMLFMRWMRKHLSTVQEAQDAVNVNSRTENAN